MLEVWLTQTRKNHICGLKIFSEFRFPMRAEVMFKARVKFTLKQPIQLLKERTIGVDIFELFLVILTM